ncbi:MAG: dethiobiotin synthase [Peptoniphilaceae bacterium]
MTKSIFITGTDTDIGKTYVTGLIFKKLIEEKKKAIYYKAALSGAEKVDNKLIPGDAKFVCDMAGIVVDPSSLVSYTYENAISPHLACKIEGNPLKLEKIKDDFNYLSKKYDYIVVEGSGGIICPIVFDEEKILLEDIIKTLNLPTLVIADAGLGTINHTVLTSHYLQDKNIEIKGIILNNFDENELMHRDNLRMIETISGVEVIGTLKKDQDKLDIDIDKLLKIFKEI